LWHAVAVESRTDILVRFVANRSDVRKAIVGVAHDFDGELKSAHVWKIDGTQGVILTAGPQILRTNITVLPPMKVALHVSVEIILSSFNKAAVVGDVKPLVQVVVVIASPSTYDNTAVWTRNHVIVLVV
jgi:hypothetical protein